MAFKRQWQVSRQWHQPPLSTLICVLCDPMDLNMFSWLKCSLTTSSLAEVNAAFPQSGSRIRELGGQRTDLLSERCRVEMEYCFQVQPPHIHIFHFIKLIQIITVQRYLALNGVFLSCRGGSWEELSGGFLSSSGWCPHLYFLSDEALWFPWLLNCPNDSCVTFFWTRSFTVWKMKMPFGLVFLKKPKKICRKDTTFSKSCLSSKVKQIEVDQLSLVVFPLSLMFKLRAFLWH